MSKIRKKLKLPNKSLCDFTKSELDLYEKKLRKVINNPKYICKKCFRASGDKDYLCKPNKL